METFRGTSELGAGFTSFAMVLGIILLALFLPLWITSFDSVHKRMGNVKWKKLQKWSYVLYACLFVHAMCIQVGGMLNPRGGAPRQTTETVAAVAEGGRQGERTDNAQRAAAASDERTTGRSAQAERVAESAGAGSQAVARSGGNEQAVEAVRASGGRAQAKGFADIQVGAATKRWINIASLVLIYGSYLFLRVRKARKNAQKKITQPTPII